MKIKNFALKLMSGNKLTITYLGYKRGKTLLIGNQQITVSAKIKQKVIFVKTDKNPFFPLNKFYTDF